MQAEPSWSDCRLTDIIFLEMRTSMDTPLPNHSQDSVDLAPHSGCGQCQAVVISLRSSARGEHVAKIQGTCPVPCQLWDATDGREMPPDQIEQIYQPNLLTPNYPFELRPGEIGCFLSHRRIWQWIVDQQIPQLLIFEDDIAFLPNFAETLAFAQQHAPDGSYVQFQVRNLKFNSDNLSGSSSTPRLVRPDVVPLRCTAQLVTLGAAQRLLANSQQIDRPVDALIQMTWLHGVEVLVALPQSVIEVSNSLGGSTIGINRRRRSLWQSLTRQWKRSLYRRSIAGLSKAS
jgi:GR25 family glycosyltransferase involved in LPS biosynthesis